MSLLSLGVPVLLARVALTNWRQDKTLHTGKHCALHHWPVCLVAIRSLYPFGRLTYHNILFIILRALS